jgi:hypothetical protein
MEDCNELGYYDNIYVNNVQYNDGPELRYESYPLLHSIGITFRKNAFFIGLEYTKGKGRATYELPNIEKVGQYYNGTEYVNTYAIESYRSTSEIKYKNLKVTVGIMFGGGSKWKKIAIDKFNKG